MIRIFLKKLKVFNCGIAALVATILLSNVSNILAQEQGDFKIASVATTQYKLKKTDQKSSLYDDFATKKGKTDLCNQNCLERSTGMLCNLIGYIGI